jgi:hypothetical protein
MFEKQPKGFMDIGLITAIISASLKVVEWIYNLVMAYITKKKDPNA